MSSVGNLQLSVRKLKLSAPPTFFTHDAAMKTRPKRLRWGGILGERQSTCPIHTGSDVDDSISSVLDSRCGSSKGNVARYLHSAGSKTLQP